jgi:glycosyltransferase involved in cell wall biosynthesis
MNDCNTDKKPTISVALCTYNGEQYIEEQLKSILNQDYRELEIIIVDDCSTDNTIKIINEYAAVDSRIKLFVNDSNLGFNKNFEKALGLTSADYIAISDQDDLWLPEKISTLRQNIGNSWLIFSNSSFIGDTPGGQLLEEFKLPSSYKGVLLNNYVTGHTVLISRELLRHAAIFPTLGYYDWWLGFIATYHQKITYLPQTLTLYRIHAASVVQTAGRGDNWAKKKIANAAAMLKAFSQYEELETDDKIFLGQLATAYHENQSNWISPVLIKIIFKYYEELFPTLKRRKTLSKLNFAFKYSKTLGK